MWEHATPSRVEAHDHGTSVDSRKKAMRLPAATVRVLVVTDNVHRGLEKGATAP